MLVLSRRVGESVTIGGNIVVTVLAVRGKQVKIGFEAPRGVSIWRQEKDWFDGDTREGSEDLGSVADKIIRGSSVPVLVDHPR